MKKKASSKEAFIARKKAEYADKNYHLRCMKTLECWDAPLEGWKAHL